LPKVLDAVEKLAGLTQTFGFERFHLEKGSNDFNELTTRDLAVPPQNRQTTEFFDSILNFCTRGLA